MPPPQCGTRFFYLPNVPTDSRLPRDHLHIHRSTQAGTPAGPSGRLFHPAENWVRPVPLFCPRCQKTDFAPHRIRSGSFRLTPEGGASTIPAVSHGERHIYMTDAKLSPESDADVKAAEALHQKHLLITEQMRGVIVGQDEVIEQLMAALLCRGHCILEGVPGLAKTLMVSTLASLLSQSFRRIQFTPDLMPFRHHRLRNSRGRSHHRQTRLPLHSRSVVWQHDSGRRNQSHAAQNPERAARSHAGKATHERGLPNLSAAQSIPGPGDAESH